MRDCYDSLLSAAAATANSAYGIPFLLEETIYFVLFFNGLYSCAVCHYTSTLMVSNQSPQ